MKMFLSRALPFLLALCLLVSPAVPVLGEEEEEEVYFVDVTPPPGLTNVYNEPAGTEETRKQSTGTVIEQKDGSILLTLTAVGDITIGGNVQKSGKSIFQKELEKQNGDVNFIFRNVKTIFEMDSLTIGNFEGVLAEEYRIPSNKKNNDYLFLAPTSYASVLSDNSVEMVTIENNHIGDFGEDGILSTRSAIESAGTCWADASQPAVYEISGIRIIMFAYQTLNQPYTSEELAKIVADKIAGVREEYDIVIVYYHWGNELDYTPRDNQVALGRATIDAGADLVLGTHSHRINPIECYNGKYIVYSLANCSFAGNNKPSDMYTFIFQNRFKFKNGQIVQNIFRIIPCRISSRKDYNDFTITPLTEQTNIDTVINTMKQAGRNLTYAVENYPLDWE